MTFSTHSNCQAFLKTFHLKEWYLIISLRQSKSQNIVHLCHRQESAVIYILLSKRKKNAENSHLKNLLSKYINQISNILSLYPPRYSSCVSRVNSWSACLKLHHMTAAKIPLTTFYPTSVQKWVKAVVSQYTLNFTDSSSFDSSPECFTDLLSSL